VFSTSDTIVAIATPPGRGGIGVVRLSGPAASSIARRLLTHDRPLEPRRATFTTVRAATAEDGSTPLDHAVATSFAAPHSYTGDDVVEVSVHGSPVVLRAIVSSAIACGARLAEPGEFTLRAFLNGRIDLMQAEAVADLIEAATPLQARAAFDQLEGTLTQQIGDIDRALFELAARLEASIDFPEEGYHFLDAGAVAAALDCLIARTAALLAGAERGRLIRDGLQVAIVGEPNVGKSSLFNALAGAARAIVTEVPGTTRDLVTEVVDVEGLRVTLVDTAGLRDSDDPIEAQGVERAMQAQRVADLVLVVLDSSRPLAAAALSRAPSASSRKVLYVANKADLPRAWTRDDTVEVSAATGAGLDSLRERIAHALDAEPSRDVPALTNVRHIALVARAHDALVRARRAAAPDVGALSEEFVLADLQDARAALEEISGRRAPEDLLAEIFSRFCIGK
jgi:tRNA modification GTPase